jgi:hypothetical protein
MDFIRKLKEAFKEELFFNNRFGRVFMIVMLALLTCLLFHQEGKVSLERIFCLALLIALSEIIIAFLFTLFITVFKWLLKR